MQLCFHTCSHTHFPIKGIDKCQQQWFLTARFSSRKKRTKFTIYVTFSLHRIERTIAKQHKSPGQSRSQALSCYPPRSTHRHIDDKEFERSRLKSVLGRRSSYDERNKEASTMLCSVIKQGAKHERSVGENGELNSRVLPCLLGNLPLPKCFTTEQNTVEASLFVLW